METTEKKANDRTYKIIIGVLVLIIAVLTWQLIVTKTTVTTFTVEKEKTVTQNTELQNELDSLLKEHEKIKAEYGSLSGKLAEKDSLILAKAEEIQQLIASQADYKRIKKKLEYLRGITQGYITQIDSLYRENKTLKTENIKIKEDYSKEVSKTAELTKDKESLTEKVSLASSLKAYNIKGVPVRSKSGGKKEELADKAKRAEKIKVSFTLSENLIIPGGNKSIYIRIARPDGKILTLGEGYSFEYGGEQIQYSVKNDINYQNKATDVTMYWNKAEEFTPGSYVVSVFTDGQLIGESQFSMK